MPRLSVVAVRLSLVYLCVGFTLGALMLSNKGIGIDDRLWALLPAHIEFLLMGWILQAAMGVGFWILPRNVRGEKRGNPLAAASAVLLLNLGVLLVASSSWLTPLRGLAVLGRASELVAALAFVVVSWSRLRGLPLPSR